LSSNGDSRNLCLVIDTEECQPLAVVVGRNCQRIRKSIGLSQDEFASYARDAGLRWSTSRVSDFEKARTAPAFATVLLVSLALQRASEVAAGKNGEAAAGVGITPADLVGREGCVQLTEDLSLPAHHLAIVLAGGGWVLDDWYLDYLKATIVRERQQLIPVSKLGGFSLDFARLCAALLRRSGLAEDRMAKKLRITRERLAEISALLWQRTFSEERDRRAGSDANQQRKGHAARELQTELEQALGTDGNG
jgi:transcriptional regulator with XRE-family HTH domain